MVPIETQIKHLYLALFLSCIFEIYVCFIICQKFIISHVYKQNVEN